MKIRFVRTISVDIEKTKLHEIWDHTYNKWAEVQIEEIFVTGNHATLKTYDGDFILAVPTDAFVSVKEEKRTLAI